MEKKTKKTKKEAGNQMKKYMLLLLFLMLAMVGELAVGEKVVEAAETTDLTITFFKSEFPMVEEPIKAHLTLPETSLSATHSGRLPSTGDLISSLIWTLLGCSVLIILIGVYSLKNIMLQTS